MKNINSLFIEIENDNNDLYLVDAKADLTIKNKANFAVIDSMPEPIKKTTWNKRKLNSIIK